MRRKPSFKFERARLFVDLFKRQSSKATDHIEFNFKAYMHKCPPPKKALNTWLKAYGTIENENYGHLLLEQIGKGDEALRDALRPYFESAHQDAREYFHKRIGISLHPDGKLPQTVAYPNCLPSKALRGLFGEVIAGLVTEAYQEEFVGGYAWQVPIFLFREHDDVEKYGGCRS